MIIRRWVVRQQNAPVGQKFISLRHALADAGFKNKLSEVIEADDRFEIYDRKFKKVVA